MFERIQEVLRGKRLPLTVGADSMLYFMLDGPSGCDSWMRPGRWVMQYGWHFSNHRYLLDEAPPVVSWLLEQTRGELTAIFELVPGGPFRRAHGRRAVWIAPSSELVTIQIREATDGMSLDRPGALAQPPELVDAARNCPHCAGLPPFLRQSDGALVCQVCGRSFR